MRVDQLGLVRRDRPRRGEPSGESARIEQREVADAQRPREGETDVGEKTRRRDEAEASVDRRRLPDAGDRRFDGDDLLAETIDQSGAIAAGDRELGLPEQGSADLETSAAAWQSSRQRDAGGDERTSSEALAPPDAVRAPARLRVR
jgi:hypothetical protein